MKLSEEFVRLLGDVCGVAGGPTDELRTCDSDGRFSGRTMGTASTTFLWQLAVSNCNKGTGCSCTNFEFMT